MSLASSLVWDKAEEGNKPCWVWKKNIRMSVLCVCVFWHDAAGYQDESQYIKHVAVPNPDVG